MGDMKAKEADKKGHADFDAGQKVLKDTETAGLALQKELNDMKKQADDVMKKEVTLDQVAADASKRIADLAVGAQSLPQTKAAVNMAHAAAAFLEVSQGPTDLAPAVKNFEDAAMKALSDVAEKRQGVENMIAQVENKNKETEGKIAEVEGKIKEATEKLKSAEQQVKEMDMKAKEADKKGHADFDAGQKVLKDTETAGLALQKELNDMKKQADDVMKKEVTLDQVAADASKRIADLAVGAQSLPQTKAAVNMAHAAAAFLEVSQGPTDL